MILTSNSGFYRLFSTDYNVFDFFAVDILNRIDSIIKYSGIFSYVILKNDGLHIRTLFKHIARIFLIIKCKRQYFEVIGVADMDVNINVLIYTCIIDLFIRADNLQRTVYLGFYVFVRSVIFKRMIIIQILILIFMIAHIPTVMVAVIIITVIGISKRFNGTVGSCRRNAHTLIHGNLSRIFWCVV